MSPYSVLELFKVGLGPSSSHTLGPMLAATRFITHCQSINCIEQIDQLRVGLYGSLALTGIGHATDKAVVLGLAGLDPATVDIDSAEHLYLITQANRKLTLSGGKTIAFDMDDSIRFFKTIFLPEHPNGLRFSALDGHGIALANETFFSTGGGTIASADEMAKDFTDQTIDERRFPFMNAQQLFEYCQTQNISIAALVSLNENALGLDQNGIAQWAITIQQAMQSCMARGMLKTGILPGGLKVRRRASEIASQLSRRASDQLSALDWVNVYALAVNEENAAGGRVVTAPTNGSAGVIPAVLEHLKQREQGLSEHDAQVFLLTCAAIGWLYKRNASISAAEMGCQGEIGVASSMAAAGMAAVLGGTPLQVQHAAEVAMEHHLGMTCDPIGGLVQIPCIERNAFGAAKAIQAARLATLEQGDFRVSLDQCIETMRQTGVDMASQYKETALGGLAVNVVEC